MVECNGEVDELGVTGCDDKGKQFVNVLDSGDGDEEMKKDFLMRNGGWINHGAILGVLWV